MPIKLTRPIDNASRAVGGTTKIVQNFDYLVYRDGHSSSDGHASSIKDEGKVLNNIRNVKPFSIKPNRKHASFCKIKSHPLGILDRESLMNGSRNIKQI